jgi:hypothetical protein
MFWWIVIITVVGFIGARVFVENRRGSQGESAADDQHLQRRDPRGGGGTWTAP